MATVNLTKNDFRETVEDNDIVLVDFWAEWCGPCKTFGPVYERVSEDHSDIVFGKVDTDEEQELGQGFGIRSIPTLMAFREGIMVFSQAGALPEAAVEDLISQIRELDMDDVRAQVEAQQAEQASA